MFNLFGKKENTNVSTKKNTIVSTKKNVKKNTTVSTKKNVKALNDSSVFSVLKNNIYNCKYNNVGCSPHVNRLITDVNRKILPGYKVKTDNLKTNYNNYIPENAEFGYYGADGSYYKN
jgi:hypothetical protein